MAKHEIYEANNPLLLYFRLLTISGLFNSGDCDRKLGYCEEGSHGGIKCFAGNARVLHLSKRAKRYDGVYEQTSEQTKQR